MGGEIVQFRTPLSRLRQLALWFSSLSAGAAIILPVLEYTWVWQGHGRWEAEAYMHWAVVGVIAILAWVGHTFQSTAIISVHVVFGLTLSAALGAHNTVVYSTFSSQCNQVQLAFIGCSTCSCAADDSCTSSQLGKLTGCTTCQAWGTDICGNFKQDRIVLAIMGAVTVVALSVPLVPSLVMLLRLMSARSYATVTLQSAYMLVEEQADLMATGQNPNVPYAELSMAMRQLDASGQSKLLSSSSRCEEQLKLATARSISPSMAATLRVQPSAPPHDLQPAPSAPSLHGDWHRGLSHTGPSGLGPGSPAPLLNPYYGKGGLSRSGPPMNDTFNVASSSQSFSSTHGPSTHGHR